MTRDDVIRGFGCCIEKLDTVTNKTHGFNCAACPYYAKCDSTGYLVGLPLMRDALALLKAREPIEPVQDMVGDALFWICGKCGHDICSTDWYCSNCGRAVKWE